jgi:hypothetical protein
MAEKLKAGGQVLVRSGLREIEARVLDVYGGNDSHLFLAVPLHGSEGDVLSEETISMPIRRGGPPARCRLTEAASPTDFEGRFADVSEQIIVRVSFSADLRLCR